MQAVRGLLLVMISILIASCSQKVAEDGCVLIDTENNPDILPYRFIEFFSTSPRLYPLILNHQGFTGLFGIGPDEHFGDSVISIRFGAYPISSDDWFCLVHISPVNEVSHFAIDYDNDGAEELAITYVRRDTVWVQLLNRDCQILYEKEIAVGRDLTGDSIWDGFSYIAAIQDLNGDGKVEILVACNAGADRYPRRLICVDCFRDTVLWEFDYAGHLNAQDVHSIQPPSCRDPVILLADWSPNNGVISGAMDDAHSHLMCLNADGSLRWMRIMGGKFTSTKPYIIDHNSDGIPEVCAPYSYRTVDSLLAGGLLVLDVNGRLIDSVAFEHQINSIFQHDYDTDGNQDIIISLDDGTLIIWRQDFSPIAKFKYVKPLEIVRTGDFCGNGETQILASGPRQELWLFDLGFRPMAHLQDGGDLQVLYSEKEGFVFLVQRGNATSFNVLERNPWHRGFFIKYRNYITGVIGALAATLAVVVFYQRRTRHNLAIIRKQKSELEDLHDKLHAAQRQIITDEKYKQAKDIAGGVAHEIHNALCPAVNSLEVLNNRLELTGDADLKRNYDLLRLTKAAISRGLQMTELVSTYSKLETEKNPQPIDFKQLMGEIVEANRLRLDEMGADVKLNIPAEIEIKCTKTHAFSLFNNLMLNSLDALAEAANRVIDISARYNQNQMIIQFADTGQGISEESIAKIYDLFYSTKPSTGTGLGLSMVKKIVELYNGTIEVESSIDKGTKFTIIFPRT